MNIFEYERRKKYRQIREDFYEEFRKEAYFQDEIQRLQRQIFELQDRLVRLETRSSEPSVPVNTGL